MANDVTESERTLSIAKIKAIAETLSAVVGAVAAAAASIGLLFLVLFSFVEPSGFPRFDPARLTALLAPIALSGLVIVASLAALSGFPRYLFYLSSGQISFAAWQNWNASRQTSNQLLIYFAAISVIYALWLVALSWQRDFTTQISVVALIAVFFVSIVTGVRDGILAADSPAITITRCTAFRTFAGLFFLLPFLVSSLWSLNANVGNNSWIGSLAVLTVALIAANSFIAGTSVYAIALGPLVFVGAAAFVAPRVFLGAALHQLGLVNVQRIITLSSGEDSLKIAETLKGCVREVEFEKVKPLAKAAIAKGDKVSTPMQASRFHIFIENELGLDVVVNCDAPKSRSKWVSLPESAILLREPGP